MVNLRKVECDLEYSKADIHRAGNASSLRSLTLHSQRVFALSLSLPLKASAFSSAFSLCGLKLSYISDAAFDVVTDIDKHFTIHREEYIDATSKLDEAELLSTA